jgi:hypothetical protein
MRGYVGFALSLLGAFLIFAVALLRFWIGPSQIDAVKYPLNEYEVLHLAGSGSYFNKSAIQEESNVAVSATYTIKGDIGQGGGGTAVWDFFTYVYDLTNHQIISYSLDQEALDRNSGELVNCCGSYITSMPTGKADHSVQMTGLATFPLGDHATTYQNFDNTAGKAEPNTYQGEASVDGILTYKYVEKVSPTLLGTVDVPGSVISEPSVSEVPLGEYYSTVNTYYVDPETGGVLDVTENPTITLGNSPTQVTILGSQISVTETAPSIATIVAQDRHDRGELTLVRVTLPLIGLIGGLLLLVLGIVALRLRADRDEPDARLMHELDAYA